MKTKQPSSLLNFSLGLLMLAVFVFAPALVAAQGLDRIERERALSMLSIVKNDLKNNYYDPNFRGMDLEARFKTAEDRVKQASSLGQAFGIIAQVLLDLNDSHTIFLPPRRPETIIYGWQMRMVEDKCYVVAVKPGSDAEAQGVKAGDLVLSVQGFKPSRKEFWKMRYYYNLISPRSSLHLVLQSPKGETRELDVKAKVRSGSVVRDLTSNIGINDYLRELEDDYLAGRHRYYEGIEDVFVWKMPAFDLSTSGVDDLMGKAKKRKSFILDLRGNGGGAEETLLRMVGHFFDKEINPFEIKGRKEKKPIVAKPRLPPYDGKVVILIDSESGSSSELLARLLQLEKRATIIGDLSAGAVMRARYFPHDIGSTTLVSFGVQITDADAVMSDGNSLEHVGVAPDELVVPTGEDLAEGRDIVLARAFELVGVKVNPKQAGGLFPIIWPK